MIDTGATFCAIDDTVAQQLGLQPVGMQAIGGAAGIQQHPLYAAKMSFPGTQLPSLESSRLVGVNLAGHAANVAGGPLLALVGRDLLKHFVMVYNGPMGLITMTI